MSMMRMPSNGRVIGSAPRLILLYIVTFASRESHTKLDRLPAPGLGIKLPHTAVQPHAGGKSMELNGAVALVTGGNGGLGQRICHALAKEGAHIAVMYAQSREQAEGVARELTSKYQVNAAAFGCDITDQAAVDKLVGDVSRSGEHTSELQLFRILV